MWENLAVGVVLLGAALYWVRKVIPALIYRRVAHSSGKTNGSDGCSGCSGCGSDSGGCH